MRIRSWRLLPAVALLILALGATSGCTLGCPTALATGIVVADGTDLVLRDETGTTHPVVWPDGFRVGQEAGELVLTDRFGGVKARIGDRIEIAGGVATDDRFHGCGDVVVVPPSPSATSG